MVSRRLRAAVSSISALALLGLVSASPALAGGVSVSRVASPPAGARAGSAYTLSARLTNDAARAASGRVTVPLLRPGTRPRVVGGTRVSATAGRTAAFRVAIRIPYGLADGSYFVAACFARRPTPPPARK